jgi:hypothetical protein
LGDFPIRNADDFQRFVIAAMQEYTKAERETVYPSFEQVMLTSPEVCDPN